MSNTDRVSGDVVDTYTVDSVSQRVEFNLLDAAEGEGGQVQRFGERGTYMLVRVSDE